MTVAVAPKVATGGEPLDARDRLLVDAAGIAHQAGGAPVLTHCEGGRGGVEQIAALARAGVRADAIILSRQTAAAAAAERGRSRKGRGSWLPP
jgi:predicted metal-dependent phosphotriesterase family hydrolase